MNVSKDHDHNYRKWWSHESIYFWPLNCSFLSWSYSSHSIAHITRLKWSWVFIIIGFHRLNCKINEFLFQIKAKWKFSNSLKGLEQIWSGLLIFCHSNVQPGAKLLQKWLSPGAWYATLQIRFKLMQFFYGVCLRFKM